MQVIAVLGEIDCRLGLLSAVEKLKYPDLDAAMHALAHIYSHALADLKQDRRLLRVWVSPVPPVLSETADVVRQFNQILQDKVCTRSFKDDEYSLAVLAILLHDCRSQVGATFHIQQVSMQYGSSSGPISMEHGKIYFACASHSADADLHSAIL